MLANTISKQLSQTAKGQRPVTSKQECDLDLIRRIANEDESALRELYAAYGQRMYAYALRLTASPATADDVVQDTLIAVWQSARSFRGEGRVLAWLLGIVHHTAMKGLRHIHQPITEEMEIVLPAPTALPEERIQTKEEVHSLQKGLKSLSPEHRAILELVFYQGMSLNEVAEVCHCPLGTVKSRLSYARRHLRGILSRQEEAK